MAGGGGMGNGERKEEWGELGAFELPLNEDRREEGRCWEMELFWPCCCCCWEIESLALLLLEEPMGGGGNIAKEGVLATN